MPSRPSDKSHTETLMDEVPEERRAHMRSRTRQGAVLVMVGSLMGMASFAFMFLAVFKELNLGRWLLGFMMVLFLMSFVIIALGATRWSSQLVGSVSKDTVSMVSGFAAAILPWKKKDTDD